MKSKIKLTKLIEAIAEDYFDLEGFAQLKDRQQVLLDRHDKIVGTLLSVKNKENKLDPSFIPDANHVSEVVNKHTSLLGNESTISLNTETFVQCCNITT